MGRNFVELANLIKARLNPPIKSAETELIRYNGSVADFRAWMDKFLARGPGMTIIPDMTQDEKREMIGLLLKRTRGEKAILLTLMFIIRV